jgi:GH24 family phage-related lysozyme (muramidase)
MIESILDRVSRKGVTFTAGWEGWSSVPYFDVDHWSSGYGTPAHSWDSPITQAEGWKRLRNWLNRRVVPEVPKHLFMRRHERDALASFGYNLGTGALQNSTLGARLKSREGRTYRGRKRVYREEIPKWDKVNGVAWAGLTKRRAAEVALACNGDYSGRP